MINIISKFLIYSIFILPIALITGPAIPDIIITLSGIFFIFYVFYKNEYSNILGEKLFLISILFWLYLLFISFFAENKIISFRESIIFIRVLLIPIFIYFWISNKSPRLEKILLVIFICIIFVVIDTLFQFTQYDGQNGFGKDLLGFQSDWYGRLTGPFGDELIPGAYLSRFSFLGLVFLLIFIKDSKTKIAICTIYLSVMGLAIFATGERMALATYSMGLLFLLLFYKNYRSIFLISLVLLISLILLTKIIHPSYNDFKIIKSTPYHLGLTVEKSFICETDKKKECKKIINLQPSFSKVIKNFDKSPYGEIYLLSWEMFKDNVVFGIGLNNFTNLCENNLKYNNLMKNYVCVSHPHNFYIQWLVETGIIGLFLFLTYLLYLFYFILFKNYNKFSLISIATLLVLFWPVMSTGSLLKNWNGVSTFFIIGLCIALTKIKKEA